MRAKNSGWLGSFKAQKGHRPFTILFFAFGFLVFDFVFVFWFWFFSFCLFVFVFVFTLFLLFGFGFLFYAFCFVFFAIWFQLLSLPENQATRQTKARNNKEIIDLGLKQGVFFLEIVKQRRFNHAITRRIANRNPGFSIRTVSINTHSGKPMPSRMSCHSRKVHELA